MSLILARPSTAELGHILARTTLKIEMIPFICLIKLNIKSIFSRFLYMYVHSL